MSPVPERGRFVEAILCADMHFSDKIPVARSCHDSWIEVMDDYLHQLRNLAESYDRYSPVPVVCAGDLFDKWKCTPFLINFLIDSLPQPFLAIPGQHDIPHHNYSEIKHSAFWTLIKCGRLIEINNKEGYPFTWGKVNYWPFPWGKEIKPRAEITNGLPIDVAIIHSYIWTKNTGYPDAPRDKRARSYLPRLEGYDIAVFGDNHKPFTLKPKNGPLIYNCGSFMRRKIDEINHRPRVGLLYSDGTIEDHYLDCSRDEFIKFDDIPLASNDIGFETLVEEMLSLANCAVDFREIMQRLISSHKTSDRVKSIINYITSLE